MNDCGCQYNLSTLTTNNLSMDCILHSSTHAHNTTTTGKRSMMWMAFVLISFWCMAWSHPLQAQQVSYNYRNAALEDVLNDLAKQSDHKFFYNKQWLKDAPKVTLQATNISWEKALEAVLEGRPFAYKKVDNIIYLSRKDLTDKNDDTDTTRRQLQGRVLDEQQKAIPGVTVGIKGKGNITKTDESGYFDIEIGSPQDMLQFSSIAYEKREMTAGVSNNITVNLKQAVTDLAEVVVPFNTGYQTISRERATGAFNQVDEKTFNRRVGPDVLSRIEGIVPGVYFNASGTATSTSKINIRDQSSVSIYVNQDPLIILDNFPFEGDLASINPNDVASITVLKDAAAASISANGVIVISTKKGGYNQKMRVGFNTNVTVGGIPNLQYDRRYLAAPDFIDIEKKLFNEGYYDMYIQDNFTFPALSPAVDIMLKARSGQLTEQQADMQLDALRGIDLRDDYRRYLYRNSVQQQYALNFSGGGNNQTYYFGLGYDRNTDGLQGNHNDRFTFKGDYLFSPVPKLEVTANIRFGLQHTVTPNTYSWGNLGGVYPRTYPYAQLTNTQGQPLAIAREHSTAFLDSLENLGFLDWRYRPLDEIALADRRGSTQNLVLMGSVRYKIASYLNIEGQFQREAQQDDSWNLQPEQAYAVKSQINAFAQYNAATRTFTYPFPRGGVLEVGNRQLVSHNFRLQANLNKSWSDHLIAAVMGAEIRQTKTEGYTRTSLGYDDEYGSAASTIDYVNAYPINGGWSGYIQAPANGINGTTQRFLSYFASAAYTYLDRYTLSASGRRDGANIFGVRTNDRITPFWSAGLSWELSKESFYALDVLPYAKLRTTYGYNGNIYYGGAYLTAMYGMTSTLSNLPYGIITSAPNPDLRWEKVGNFNVGLDFRFKGGRVSGSIDWYQKRGKGLIEDVPLATSTGVSTYRGNAASSRTKGLDIGLNAQILKGVLGWTANLALGMVKATATEYSGGVRTGESLTSGGATVVGQEILGLYSYRWAGLDPATGDPQSYYGKDVSKDYTAIITSTNVDSLVYHGSIRPRFTGGLRNTFSWKGLSVSANILFKLKYYYRRPTVNLNYQEIITAVEGPHSDYLMRWQQPGDEAHTSVPSMVYLTDPRRNEFYRFSEVTVSRGDHIRLQDVRLDYELQRLFPAVTLLRNSQVYVYANNLGVIWRANKEGLDPDFNNGLVTPKSYAVGVRFGL
jgi:TonB-dependent starch-binding outer membrane protein SusC